MGYLLVIYYSVPRETWDKVSGKGYQVLSWTLPGPGHLIPGLIYHFQGKGNKKWGKCQIWEILDKMHQEYA